MAQRLKRQPTMWDTWVRSLDREDPLEKEMDMLPNLLVSLYILPQYSTEINMLVLYVLLKTCLILLKRFSFMLGGNLYHQLYKDSYVSNFNSTPCLSNLL